MLRTKTYFGTSAKRLLDRNAIISAFLPSMESAIENLCTCPKESLGHGGCQYDLLDLPHPTIHSNISVVLYL